MGIVVWFSGHACERLSLPGTLLSAYGMDVQHDIGRIMQHWWREVAQQMSLKQSSWLIKAYVGYSGNPEVPICLSEKTE